MKSIQRNLLLWLSLALVVGMGLVIAATYAYAFAQITRTFDEELVRVAEAVHLSEDWAGPRRTRVPSPGFNLALRAYDAAGNTFFVSTRPGMPGDLPHRFVTGYDDIATRSGVWHVYTHVGGEGIVQVGQPDETRKALARELSFRMALPELVMIPLLVLLIAWVQRRGLAPLRGISRRVQERDAKRLDPLPTEDVPEELGPLIEQINALLARLSDSMATHRRFVEDAAHELRTPVAALALQAQVAARATQPASRAAAFADLDQGIARTARVVEQLLRLARLGPDAAPEELEPLDLAELAREVVGGMALAARARGVDLGAEAPGPAPMRGAPAQLRVLITNLVDNAMRYAPRDSEVTVKVAREDSALRLTVVDAGPGLPAAERERVFDRFQRAAGDDTPGIGLGLAIAKAIVERHGGRIALEDATPGRDPPGLAASVVFPKESR